MELYFDDKEILIKNRDAPEPLDDSASESVEIDELLEDDVSESIDDNEIDAKIIPIRAADSDAADADNA